MKLNDVKVGGRYLAKVSQHVQVVKVLAIQESSTFRGRSKTLIQVVNEATGRRITIRSPQRLRGPAPSDGCEFCSQDCNRPDGAFTCPYCRKVWQAVSP